MIETFQVDPSDIGHIWPALDVLRTSCGGGGIDFFMVGAAAQDLLLEHVYGIRRLRATKDVDAAVAVQSWEEYESVIKQLVGALGFERAPEPHRVRRGTLIVDIVSYGELATAEDQIEWPGGTTAMSMLGYREVNEAAVGIVDDGGSRCVWRHCPGWVCSNS